MQCESLIPTSLQQARCISQQTKGQSNSAVGIRQKAISYSPILPLSICSSFKRSLIQFPQVEKSEHEIVMSNLLKRYRKLKGLVITPKVE